MSERKAELVTGDDYGAVITAWTPLETTLVGVHPRLHGTRAQFDLLRERVNSGQEPWKTKFASFIKLADAAVAFPVTPNMDDLKGDIRALGEVLVTLSVAWQVTRDPKYLDAARTQLLTMVKYPQEKWDGTLVNGHWLYGHGVAYDLLFHDLDDETLRVVRDNLYVTLERAVAFIALHKGWMADALACNHLPVHMAGIIAGATAIYGEKPGVGPWLKFTIEKLTAMGMSLGADGLSQESIGYGEYYCAYLLKACDIALNTLGLDFMRGSIWIKTYPASQLYLAIAKNHWTSRDSLLTFGDGVRYHWHGPSFMLRKIASLFNDGFSQAFADECDAAGTSAPDPLDLLWYDPAVVPKSREGMPLLAHFNDKGVVAGRSGWKGDETIWAFKCGPHFGHHAATQHPHDVGGGHMQPDNGDLQIVVRNERLLATDGYHRKETNYHNTILVNGIGQFGDGTEWFEGLELRKLQRFPKILSAKTKDATDMVIADVTLAYRLEAGVQQFLRSIIHQRPGIWLVMDEVRAAPASHIESLFHSDYPITPVPNAGPLSWVAQGPTAALRLTAIPLASSTKLWAKVSTQTALGISIHASAERSLLTFSTNQQGDEPVRYVVVIQTYNLADPAPPIPALKAQGTGPLLDATVTVGPMQFGLRASEESPATPTGKTKLTPVR